MPKACLARSFHIVQQPNYAGAGLTDLPQELLQSIASHLNAVEWAEGPSMACHQLHQLLLTRLVMPDKVGCTALSLLFALKDTKSGMLELTLSKACASHAASWSPEVRICRGLDTRDRKGCCP